MLKHIVSKDEVPTPKGDWDTAWQSFTVKNIFFARKLVMHIKSFRRLQKAMLKYNVSKDEVQNPKGGWDMV